MADASLLASIISGTNPLSPQMLDAYQGAQLQNAALDPAFGHNEGLGGALAKTLAGFTGPGMLQRGVQATTAANQGAMPDLAKLLASADPYTMLAGNTAGFNPIAAARLLQGATPEDVAKARLASAQAAFQGARTTDALNKMKGTDTPMYLPSQVGGGGGGTAPIAQSTTGVTTLRPDGGDLDPAALSAMPRDQATNILKRATPAQLKAYKARLSAMQGAQGGSSAARP